MRYILCRSARPAEASSASGEYMVCLWYTYDGCEKSSKPSISISLRSHVSLTKGPRETIKVSVDQGPKAASRASETLKPAFYDFYRFVEPFGMPKRSRARGSITLFKAQHCQKRMLSPNQSEIKSEISNITKSTRIAMSIFTTPILRMHACMKIQYYADCTSPAIMYRNCKRLIR